jgi:hypothetical protein
MIMCYIYFERGETMTNGTNAFDANALNAMMQNIDWSQIQKMMSGIDLNQMSSMMQSMMGANPNLQGAPNPQGNPNPQGAPNPNMNAGFPPNLGNLAGLGGLGALSGLGSMLGGLGGLGGPGPAPGGLGMASMADPRIAVLSTLKPFFSQEKHRAMIDQVIGFVSIYVVVTKFFPQFNLTKILPPGIMPPPSVR